MMKYKKKGSYYRNRLSPKEKSFFLCFRRMLDREVR